MSSKPRGICRGKNLGVLALVGLIAAFVTGADVCGQSFVTYELSMRDGVSLSTDVYEATTRASGPTIVIRTPYGRESNKGTAESLANTGYSVVSQDMRGTGDSGGTFMFFTDDGWGANQDGFDTVEWSTAGDWSNGDACLWGASALAISSLLGAGAAPPSLRCVYSLVGTGDIFHIAAYQGGAVRQELAVNWLTGLGATEALDTMYAHPTDDDFWDPVALQRRYDLVHVPIYHMGGWYDIFSQGTLDAFSGLHNEGGEGAEGHQKLVMGPWTHGGTAGELTYPPESAVPMGEDLKWFEYWLKGIDNGVADEPVVRYYLMGDPRNAGAPGNVWKTADNWPVPSTPTPFYFKLDGSISRTAPLVSDASAGYTFDPSDPVPTLGGPNLYLPAGSYDQRPTLERDDVLYFETPLLTDPLAITGRITAHLWVSSSALDTDFTVKLMDVYEDGSAMLVLDGILRMRFREGQEAEVLMTPGQVYDVDVDLWSTALVFNSGHRIAVAVSSSNYTRFDVNPNTGGPLLDSGTPVIADQTLYLDARHPSYILLPVVDL